jgi:prolyl-tRNA editing enzyme YbaK/EbsC (Cys-tRNA(Pro) deacylase)
VPETGAGNGPDDKQRRDVPHRGGIPPLCHDSTVPVYLDETLTEYETVWVTAGSPAAVFPIAPDQLRTAEGATVADLVE